MKYILLILLLFTGLQIQASDDHSLNSTCKVQAKDGSQTHYICTIKDKKIHFLDINGTMKDVAFYHGKFLSSEIKDGVISSVMKRKRESFAALEKKERESFETIFKCIKGRYKRSLEDSFLEELEMLAKGAGIDKSQVLEATLMIEMSSYVDALEVKMKQNSKKATMELMSQCGASIIGKSIFSILKKVTKPLRKLKMGCTGFVAGEGFTKNGEFLHGRNFDTGFLGVFDKYPVILRHTPKKGIPYIGMSTAGLHYSGGITGMNARGISVSTHELRTTKVRTLYSAARSHHNLRHGMRKKEKFGVIAPYMANMIVKNTTSIDQAVKLLKRYGHFGAWTFLISDSKTNETASVEVSGAIVRVAKRTKGAISQANHFRHKDTARYNFEYSVNKSLESRARILHVDQSLERSKGSIDAQWGIDLLSGHIDHYMGMRTFGRTVSKVYTSMSHVVDSASNNFWFSLGESFPTNYSTFLGIHVDFESKDRFFSFISQTRAHEEIRSQMPFFEDLLRNYTLAYMNNRDFSQSTENLKKTISFLSHNTQIAGENNFFDFPSLIMKSRLGLKLYEKTQDKLLLLEIKNDLLSIREQHFESLHTYERSQVLRDLAIIEDLEGERDRAAKLFNKSLLEVSQLISTYPSHHFMWVYIAELKVYKKRGFTKWDLKGLDLHFATAE
ncbi:C45 family peptidase [Halobacteriovorax sp. HLS]|uniref:C45 family autoproteolytic acyltransferase/hydolase n=1 Tax=Halobacteriovorax sp. HLS TaxID=2234000 RepID=UPI000FD77CCA|nr:C45 family peptidase [Halobacteriovorax sp. HLS]